MRRFRVGVFDVGAAVLVFIVLAMPARELHIGTGYRYVEASELPALLSDVARAQADLERGPSDGAAAERLAQILASRPVDQHDQALRLAGEVARQATPTRWRALLALSSAHADRIEIAEAHRFAVQATEACVAAPSAACPEHEKVRLRLYEEELAAGLQAIARGIDPRVEPERFRREMGEIHPTTTYRLRPGAAP
jgi:MoxR-like ATPase